MITTLFLVFLNRALLSHLYRKGIPLKNLYLSASNFACFHWFSLKIKGSSSIVAFIGFRILVLRSFWVLARSNTAMEKMR